MWNTNDVKPAPKSWSIILDPKQAAKYKGKISAYDDPIYIADAAVYLKAHQPDLGIDNPYELNDEQFNAAVDLLKQQRPNVGEYWSDAAEADLRRSRTATTRSGPPGSTSTSRSRPTKQPVAVEPRQPGVRPDEGATGWSDTWMISSSSRASELHVQVDGLHRLAEGERRGGAVLRRGAGTEQGVRRVHADGGRKGGSACRRTRSFCNQYHAADPSFWKRVYYWKTPVADCGNGNTDCKDYNDWVNAWTEIKG